MSIESNSSLLLFVGFISCTVDRILPKVTSFELFCLMWKAKKNAAGFSSSVRKPIDLSRIPLQCVRTIVPERDWGGHSHTFALFLSTLTSTRCHCFECEKGLFKAVTMVKRYNQHNDKQMRTRGRYK